MLIKKQNKEYIVKNIVLRGEDLKKMAYMVTILFIVCIGTICMVLAKDEDSGNVEFLGEYGWEVTGECVEREKVEIPEVFDEVYNDYNSLQRLAGLDISDYKGETAVRYTYIVTNFPTETKEKEIRANVLTVNGQPIAGDVMTVSLDGFMYSLNYLKIGK